MLVIWLTLDWFSEHFELTQHLNNNIDCNSPLTLLDWRLEAVINKITFVRTRSLQCHHVFDIAYLRPLYEVMVM